MTSTHAGVMIDPTEVEVSAALASAARAAASYTSANCAASSTAIARSVVPFGLVTRRRNSAGFTPDSCSNRVEPTKVPSTSLRASSRVKPSRSAANVHCSIAWKT